LAVTIDTPVDLERRKTYCYVTGGVLITHDENAVGLVETK